MYTYDENLLSDLHKDAYGVRPRSEAFWAAWDEADNDGKQRIWDDLLKAVSDSIQREREAQQKAIVEFESWIEMTMKLVTYSNRADCIRMLHDAHQTFGDVEYLEHCLGIPYGYLSGRKPGFLV